jgi:hypothetical protein
VRSIAIVEGTWVKFLEDHKVILGKVEKKDSNKPLSQDNFWIKTKRGFYQPNLEDIIYAFPKIILKDKLKSKINPSLRIQRGYP